MILLKAKLPQVNPIVRAQILCTHLVPEPVAVGRARRSRRGVAAGAKPLYGDKVQRP